MKELYAEGLATHGGPESWADEPGGSRPSVDRGTRKPGIEPRNRLFRGADAVLTSGRQHAEGRYASPFVTSRGPRPRASVEPLCARTGRTDDCPWVAPRAAKGRRDER